MIRFQSFLAVSLLFAGCVTGANEEPSLATEQDQFAVEGKAVQIQRSLVVTDPRVLARFPMSAVFEQFAKQAGTAQSATELYQEWWNTQNDAKHSPAKLQHVAPCKDKLNGFPLACPRQEGILATNEKPFGNGPDGFRPLALFNRFDLADGPTCGEYRVVYGKIPTEGVPQTDRTLVIFEARLPNPDPSAGLQGCAPIVEFWASLSVENDVKKRADKLEQFYFTGLALGDDERRPVIDIRNYAVDAGQIRSNQFMFRRDYFGTGQRKDPWQLREFKLSVETVKVAGKPVPHLVFVPVTVKDNAFGELFADAPKGKKDPLAKVRAAFHSAFARQVADLAEAKDINLISAPMLNKFNSGQSTSMGDEMNYETHLGKDFAAAIAAKLPAGSDLTAAHIVRRAMTTTCAGCHQLNNKKSLSGDEQTGNDLGGGLTWPDSLTFVQVSEIDTVDGEDGQKCAKLSPALVDQFLPARLKNMQTFLDTPPATRRNSVAAPPGQNLRVH